MVNIYCLLNQSVEQFPTGLRCPTIKPKSKFIQIAIQMRFPHSTLMCPLQPTLQKSSYSIGKRQQIFTDIGRLAQHRMFIAFRGQSFISVPTISTYYTISFNAFFNSRIQTICRCIYYTPKTNTPQMVAFIFNCYKNQRFTSGTTTSFPRALSAYICFINFHSTMHSITSWTNHCSSQFMKPNPYGFISCDSQHALKTQSTDTIFLTDYIPYRLKPQLEWFSCVLKYRTCYYRSLAATMATFIQSLSNRPRFFMATLRTMKTIRPTKSKKIISANKFCRKIIIKLCQVSGIIFHIPIFYILWLPESSG